MAASTLVPTTNELYTLCSYYLLQKGGTSPQTTQQTNKNQKTEDEDFDLFGNDDKEGTAKAAQQLAEEKKKCAAAAAAAGGGGGGGKEKKKVINKSMLVIEVKPATAETNLDEILKQVKNIHLEGLTWGEGFKKVPVAFGLYKLQVQCVIVDDLVSTDALVETIEEIGMTEEQKQKRREKEKEAAKEKEEDEEDQEEEEEEEEEEDMGLVQSAEIVSFNKL